MVVGGGHRILHEVLRVERVLGAVIRVCGAGLRAVGRAVCAAVRRQSPALCLEVRKMMVAVVLMLFWLMVMLRHPRASVRVTAAAAVTPGAVNGSCRAGGARVEGPGGHREALLVLLLLLQRKVVQRMRRVRMVVVVMVVVVSRFRRRVRTGARSVADGVFHKGVHVVHADRSVDGVREGNESKET